MKHEKTYASLEAGDEVFDIGINRAVTLIAEKIAKGPSRRFGADPGKAIGDHPTLGTVTVKGGRYGPYVTHDGTNATLPTLKIVAVSDPNDLLSYPLRRDDLVSEDPNQTIDFGNVFMCNAPAFVGWVANPLIAHEGYFENPKLVKLLLNGYKGKPRICLKEPPTKSP